MSHASDGRERGAALLITLLLLAGIAVALLGMLHGAGTELTSSRAAERALRELYTLEAAIAEYVARAAPFPEDWEPPGEQTFTTAAGDEVRIAVARLLHRELFDASTVRVFSVTARPATGGGRALAAMLRDSIPADPDPDTGLRLPRLTGAARSWFEMVR